VGEGGGIGTTCKVLIDGMTALGFELLLKADLQAPIIVTFRMPAHSGFVFERFYDGLKTRGYVDLSRQADDRGVVSYRMHRPALRTGDARFDRRRARRWLDEMGVISLSATAVA